MRYRTFIMPMFQSIVNHTAKSPQLCPTVWPHRQQPTRLPCPWDSPGKNTGVGCHFLLQCMKVKPLSHVQLLETPWTAAYQAPPSMGFSRQEYWSGVLLPSPNHTKDQENFTLKQKRMDVNSMMTEMLVTDKDLKATIKNGSISD